MGQALRRDCEGPSLPGPAWSCRQAEEADVQPEKEEQGGLGVGTQGEIFTCQQPPEPIVGLGGKGVNFGLCSAFLTFLSSYVSRWGIEQVSHLSLWVWFVASKYPDLSVMSWGSSRQVSCPWD